MIRQKVDFNEFHFWRRVIEHNIFRVRILLASPGNLREDREKVSKIVRHINLDSGQREGFVAEIVSWETHSRPAAGEYPQGVINDQFPDDIDIFVGMMGTYFGTPTKHWGSGTEEEFRIAYERWEKTRKPEIMFYFSDAMSSLSQIDPEQLKKRNSFRSEIAALGVYYFTYSDIVEFQFDLHNHISSAIHHVLKYKEVGKSGQAIPEESAISLRNYNNLMVQDPLVNAVSMLGKATDHMNSYTNLLLSLISDVGKLTRLMVRESRNILRATQNGKQQKALGSVNSLYGGMSEYSKSIAAKIPRFSSEFSDSILTTLRVVRIVKDNDLQNSMPLNGIVSNIGGARSALSSLIEAVESVQTGFSGWPEDILDLKVQKQIILALHQDLSASLLKSIELLDKLTDEVALNG